MTRQPPNDDDSAALDDGALDAAFAAARNMSPAPSNALMSRVLADAAAATALRAGLANPDANPGTTRSGRHAGGRSFGMFADLAGLLGGWPAIGGIATAALAGVWIGFAGSMSPGGLAAFVGLAKAEPGTSVFELLPGTDGFELVGSAGGEM
jgi:hypothetical protein